MGPLILRAGENAISISKSSERRNCRRERRKEGMKKK
jgi:hypothetical protein